MKEGKEGRNEVLREDKRGEPRGVRSRPRCPQSTPPFKTLALAPMGGNGRGMHTKVGSCAAVTQWMSAVGWGWGESGSCAYIASSPGAFEVRGG